MNVAQQVSALRRWSLFLISLLTLSNLLSSCTKQDNSTPTLPTITSLVNDGSQFTLLKTAMARAGLDATLNQAGNYTVFAPTDNAFKLFGYADAAAVNAAPLDLLRSVLQYHVIGTKLSAANIPTGTNTAQTTLLGAPVYVSKIMSTTGTSTTISVNGARILQADGAASNGVVHAIDRILLPPVYGDVLSTIQGIPQLYPSVSFRLLQIAVVRAGIMSSLRANGPFTVFAPTDAAFRAVGYDSLTITKATPTVLTSLLSYHVVADRVYTPLITNGASLSTLQGGTITAGVSTSATSTTATSSTLTSGITVLGKGNGTTPSNVIVPNITATNGVVHIIDRLLLPQ